MRGRMLAVFRWRRPHTSNQVKSAYVGSANILNVCHALLSATVLASGATSWEPIVFPGWAVDRSTASPHFACSYHKRFLSDSLSSLSPPRRAPYHPV